MLERLRDPELAQKLRSRVPGKVTRIELEEALADNPHVTMTPAAALGYANWILSSDRGWNPARTAPVDLRDQLLTSAESGKGAKEILAATTPEEAMPVLREMRSATVRGHVVPALRLITREAEEEVDRLVNHGTTGKSLPTDVVERLAPHASSRALRAARLHTGDDAALFAAAHEAHAVTVGEDIYFAEGEYAPGTEAGDDLLVHELTHVAQAQRGELFRAAAKGLVPSEVLDSSEAESELRARLAVTALYAPSLSASALDTPNGKVSSDDEHLAGIAAHAMNASQMALSNNALEAMPMVHRDIDDEAASEIDPTASQLLSDAQRHGGQPLPVKLRTELEAALSADLSAVRIHHDSSAASAARALNARAFTVGQDIYFRAGAFEPASEAGRRLIAHEVAHTQQPGGTPTQTLQISAPGDAAEREAEHFADRFVQRAAERVANAAFDTDDLRRRVERDGHDRADVRPAPPTAARADGAIHLDRTPGPREHATRMTIALGDGNSATFTVESDGGAPFTATGTTSGLTPGIYTVHTPRGATQMQIATTDTSGPRRSLHFSIVIPSSERGMLALLRRANSPIPMVVSGNANAATANGEAVPLTGGQLDQLPERVRRILFRVGGVRTISPSNAPVLLRIGNKLAQLSPSELEAFQASTIGVTSNLSAYEAGVDRYLAEVRQQQAANAAVEDTRRRLYNLDQLYDRCRQYRQMLSTSTGLAMSGRYGGGLGLGTSLGMAPTLSQMERELTAELARHNFANIDTFEAAIQDYLASVRTAAVMIGREQLDRYEHRLAEEQARYQDQASAAGLHSTLGVARGHFQRANEIRDNHASMVVLNPNEQLAPAAEFQHQQRLGRRAVAAQADSHPLLGNRDIPHEELALASEGESRNIMLRYIAARRRDVQQTRGNLTSTPDLVFELPELMSTVKERLAIQRGSFLERIINDRNSDNAIDRAIVSLAVGVLALAAGLLSGGTGTVAVLGAATALGIGSYQAFEEYRRYETLNAAHGAQLTSEDPSLAWVIVAVAGVALDGAAMVRAVNALRQPVQAFNQAHDIAALEAAMREIHELPPGTIEVVIRAARQEAEAAAAWRAVFRAPPVLRAVLVPGLDEFSRLVYAVYLTSRRGITRFELWVRTSEAIDLIGDVRRLSPEDLTRLKAAHPVAMREADAIARHGVSLRMSDEEIAHTFQNWSTRRGESAEDIMAEMSRSRGTPGNGAALDDVARLDASDASRLTSVPGVRNGAFSQWFNSLTPDEFEHVWANPRLRGSIEDRLRHPGGMHEWLPVARANVFKRWGVTAEQVADLRTPTNQVRFVNPSGGHGRVGSGTAHNELFSIIDSSGNYAEYVQRLQNWARNRLEGGVDALPPGLRP